MDADQRLKILSEKLEGTVKQISEIDAKPSFAKRVSKHFRAQGSHITNIILAGVVLSVALGRLGQKQQFEAEKEGLSETVKNLQVENTSLQEEVAKLRLQKRNIQSLVQRELDSGGWRLGPVASRLRATVLTSDSPEQDVPRGQDSSLEDLGAPTELQQGAQAPVKVRKPGLMI